MRGRKTIHRLVGAAATVLLFGCGAIRDRAPASLPPDFPAARAQTLIKIAENELGKPDERISGGCVVDSGELHEPAVGATWRSDRAEEHALKLVESYTAQGWPTTRDDPADPRWQLGPDPEGSHLVLDIRGVPVFAPDEIWITLKSSRTFCS